MPHRRARSRGSFDSHFDGLVVQFPDEPARTEGKQETTRRSKRLQEKIDIHAMLFRRTWELDEDGF